MTIRTKLIVISTISMLALTTFFTLNTINSYEEHLVTHIKEVREEAYRVKKDELQNYSEMAIRVIRSYYEKAKAKNFDTKTTIKMKREALDAIKNMRYGKNGYFWINNMENKMLMHPIKPQYDGKVFVNTPKVPFVELGTTKLKETKKEKVFIEYSFYTPATKKYSHKLSIVQRFKEWDWVVGTGVYTDYVDAKLAKEKKIIEDEMNSKIKNILLISVLILLITIFMMIKIMEKIIIEPLEKFQVGLNKFFQYLEDETVVVTKLDTSNNDEIGIMAQKTNSAIEIAIKTHQELLELREQLELKVKTTTRDLDIITKNTKESLEYGALIQKSIIPNKQKLQKVFTDHFIVKEQQNITTSQFYIFDKISDDECIYAIIDSKKDDINGVFITMLINALLKQAITYLRYTKDDNIENITSWILEYLNTNIENLQDGFDGAIVYYNRSEKVIKYAGANLPFYYYQKDILHKIEATNSNIGINKDINYTEHTVEIKDYIEFYLFTNNCFVATNTPDNFISPFETKTEDLSSYCTSDHKENILAGFMIDNTPKIIIEYEGEFTQKLVNQYIETIEDNIENIGLMSNVSTTFIEQFQNILNYGKSEDININTITPYGYIKLQKTPDNIYSVETTNIITLKDKEKIEPKLIEIKSLDRNGIKKRYRELRKSGENTHAKGGGVGFYEIAKRCIKIEYTFTQLNEDRYKFNFIAYMASSKR